MRSAPAKPRPERPRKSKKRKPVLKKIFEEIWDIAEDIFD